MAEEKVFGLIVERVGQQNVLVDVALSEAMRVLELIPKSKDDFLTVLGVDGPRVFRLNTVAGAYMRKKIESNNG